MPSAVDKLSSVADQNVVRDRGWVAGPMWGRRVGRMALASHWLQSVRLMCRVARHAQSLANVSLTAGGAGVEY